MKKKITLVNTVSAAIAQLATIANGFIIPWLIIGTFGSEANGLTQSLRQFLYYVALFEGGIKNIVVASLYSPLVKKDYAKISSIIKTSNLFFKKISIVLTAYSLILAIIYPLIVNTPFSYEYVASLAVIIASKLFLQYCFTVTIQGLLCADKKTAYVSNIQTITLILEAVISAIIVKTVPNLHLLKIVSALVFTIQPILFWRYARKNYPIQKNAVVDKKLLKSRWDGVAISVAEFIHQNTDIMIITVFLGLGEASIYAVYSLVVTGIKQICQSLWKALTPSIGKTYASGDIGCLNDKFNVFEYLSLILTLFSFSVAGLLITPFVQLYTSNIADMDYSRPLFGLMMVLAEGMYILREPYMNLAYCAGKFKDIRIHAIIETIINVVVSLSLVKPLGLVGIAIGTLLAMTYRTFYHVWYLRKHIINRPFSTFLHKFFAFALPTLALITLCSFVLPLNNPTIVSWILYAIIYSAIFGAAYTIVSIVFFRKELRELKAYIKHK